MDVACAQWGVHPTTLEPLSPTTHDAKGLLLPMAGQPGRCIINQFKTKAYLGSKCGVCPHMSAALTTVQVRRLYHPTVSILLYKVPVSMSISRLAFPSLRSTRHLQLDTS